MTGVTIYPDPYTLANKSIDQMMVCSNLSNLPKDIRRMLTIQWKELINSIDDCELLLGGNKPTTNGYPSPVNEKDNADAA